MRTIVRYTETQKFNQWWLLLLLVTINASILFSLYYQLIVNQPVGENPMSDSGLIILTIFIFLIDLLFFFFRLDTTIDDQGIHVRFFPFHLKYRSYKWDDIEKCYLRQYSPIFEYGGWGIRGWGSNRALNISGNNGIQIEFKNGNKLLIGTKSPDLVKEVINDVFVL